MIKLWRIWIFLLNSFIGIRLPSKAPELCEMNTHLTVAHNGMEFDFKKDSYENSVVIATINLFAISQSLTVLPRVVRRVRKKHCICIIEQVHKSHLLFTDLIPPFLMLCSSVALRLKIVALPIFHSKLTYAPSSRNIAIAIPSTKLFADIL